MTTNIKATNMELTDAIVDYVNKKLESVQKFVNENDDINIYVEVGKTTKHHKQGDYYKAEFDFNKNGEKFFAVSEKEDLYAAIDGAKDDLVNRIKDNKNKKDTLFRRGASSVKKMMKGISKRNPFTSKY